MNFVHGRLGSRNALDLFKVNAKQLANFNGVKQDGIFGAHVKPEKLIEKCGRGLHVHVHVHTCTHSHLQIHTHKIYLLTLASPPLMDVELSNW